MITQQYRIKEAAVLMGLSPAVLRNLCLRGELEGVYKVRASWRIPSESIERYIEQKQRMGGRN